MRIYSMTATFGKLENQTLHLEPGLNVITAPNEWGKTTWCTFLVTMLYGLDTREKNTKTTLAVKERYAPWSGAPMSGRMDLCWNGRDITIERWTKGRTPMGEFRAYETTSGLPVAELSGANCGEVLLGVEKSVFLRAGFLRLADLPVTADDALRRRLNALVTTGDESNAGDELGQKLKALKNKCKHNATGLIPQAEAQKKDLEEKLLELQTLQLQQQRLEARLREIDRENEQLERHSRHLQFAAVREDVRQLEQAYLSAESAAEHLAACEDACAGQMSREMALEQLHQHSALQQTVAALLQERASLPPQPAHPQIPARYWELTPSQAMEQSEADTRDFARLEAARKKHALYYTIYAAVALMALVIALLAHSAGVWIGAGIALVLGGLGVFGFCYWHNTQISWQMRAILDRYPGIPPQRWEEDAAFYAETMVQYLLGLESVQSLHQKVNIRLESARADLNTLLGELDSQGFLLSRNQIISNHDALLDARKEHQRACAHADALRALIKPVPQPEGDDPLNWSEKQTNDRRDALTLEKQQIHLRLGQLQGRMDTLGGSDALTQQIDRVRERLRQLDQTKRALELALKTLENAAAELQRRFAPRIAESARELMGQLTDGRYNRLNLTQDLSVNMASGEDVSTRDAVCRSDGTVDQLYFALRLSVARELTPKAPLILDDVLVRFDDTRHAAAMKLLRQEAEQKQVILFSCQSRERNG